MKLLSIMCRLHDDTPSLMRVWFLELWGGEGCVEQMLSMLIGPWVQFLKGDTGIEFPNVEV